MMFGDHCGDGHRMVHNGQFTLLSLLCVPSWDHACFVALVMQGTRQKATRTTEPMFNRCKRSKQH